MVCVNAQSIRNKMEELELMIVNNALDVILMTEHWLYSDEGNLYLPTDFIMTSAFYRTGPRGGGAAIMVNKVIKYKELKHVSKCSVENICEMAGVRLTKTGMILIAVYKPPEGDVNIFVDILEKIMYKVVDTNVDVIVAGDFNLDFLRPDVNVNKVLDIFRSFGLHKTVSEPTRFTKNLDNAFSNVDMDRLYVTVGNQLADHKDIYIKTRHVMDKVTQVDKIICRPITAIGIEAFQISLIFTDWKFMEEPEPTNFLWSRFVNVIEQVYLQSFPSKTIRIKNNKRNKKPWYGEKELHSRVSFLYDLGKNDRESVEWSLYLREKNKLRKALQTAKLHYNATLIETAKNKTKKAWDLVSQESGKNNKVETKGNISTNTFNQYYLDISKKKLDPLQTAQKIINKCKKLPDTVLFLSPVKELDILDIVLELKSSDTKDYYGLSNNLIKQIIPIILVYLTKLINESIKFGCFPDALKITKVIPLYKKGDKDNPASYRPISLTPILSKIFEKVVKKQMVDYLERNKLLSNSQYGYRSGRSTIQAVTRVVDRVINSMENGEHAQLSSIDVSKAFDTLPHDIFFFKLKYLGFEGNTESWIKSYYTGRKQCVVYRGDTSEIGVLEAGAGQGSVLGPFAFIMDEIDLEDYMIQESPEDPVNLEEFDEDLIAFVDDKGLIHSHKDENALRDFAVHRLEKINKWFEANHFSLNVDKTQILTFSLKRQNSKNIEPIKMLGIMLDSKLTWLPHIEMLHSKLSSYIFALMKLRKSLPEEILRIVYLSMMQSRMTYGIILWGHVNITNLLILQKKALRIITKAKYDAHCKPIFKRLELMTIVNLYIYNVIIFMRINMNSFDYNRDFHNYETRNRNKLTLPKHRLCKAEVGQFVLGIKIFNTLPTNIKFLNIKNFKSEMRRILIKNPFYTIGEYFDYCKSQVK